MALDADADIGLSDHLAAADVGRIHLGNDGSLLASGGTPARVTNGLVITPP